MAATTGVLMPLFTTDWSRATKRVPAGKSSAVGLSSNAAVVIPAALLARLPRTVRTNTKEGLRRFFAPVRADGGAPPWGGWSVGVSEKRILAKAYGPVLSATRALEGLGCDAING